MKKLTEKQRKLHRIRSRATLRRKRVKNPELVSFTTEHGSLLVRAGEVKPLPNRLCLNTDMATTVLFFQKLRQETKRPLHSYSHTPTSKKKGRIKRLPVYYDFETLNYISPGAALILAAEFDRINSNSRLGPSSVNIESWNDLVYGTFFHLGFFHLLGFSKARIRNQEIARPPILTDLTIMPMQTGRDADLVEAARALNSLFESIGANTELAVKLISAIVDAIENVVGHAYQHMPYEERKFIPYRWWIGGSASKTDNTVTVYVYDQGITIPVSLPIVWSADRAFASVLSRFGVGPWRDAQDGEAIAAAMLLSSTSTGISNRGKGLHKIKEIVGQLVGGEMLIVSRRGVYRYQGDVESCFAIESTLRGTYVELKAKFEPEQSK